MDQELPVRDGDGEITTTKFSTLPHPTTPTSGAVRRTIGTRPNSSNTSSISPIVKGLSSWGFSSNRQPSPHHRKTTTTSSTLNAFDVGSGFVAQPSLLQSDHQDQPSTPSQDRGTHRGNRLHHVEQPQSPRRNVPSSVMQSTDIARNATLSCSSNSGDLLDHDDSEKQRRHHVNVMYTKSPTRHPAATGTTTPSLQLTNLWSESASSPTSSSSAPLARSRRQFFQYTHNYQSSGTTKLSFLGGGVNGGGGGTTTPQQQHHHHHTHPNRNTSFLVQFLAVLSILGMMSTCLLLYRYGNTLSDAARQQQSSFLWEGWSVLEKIAAHQLAAVTTAVLTTTTTTNNNNNNTNKNLTMNLVECNNSLLGMSLEKKNDPSISSSCPPDLVRSDARQLISNRTHPTIPLETIPPTTPFNTSLLANQQQHETIATGSHNSTITGFLSRSSSSNNSDITHNNTTISFTSIFGSSNYTSYFGNCSNATTSSVHCLGQHQETHDVARSASSNDASSLVDDDEQDEDEDGLEEGETEQIDSEELQAEEEEEDDEEGEEQEGDEGGLGLSPMEHFKELLLDRSTNRKEEYSNRTMINGRDCESPESAVPWVFDQCPGVVEMTTNGTTIYSSPEGGRHLKSNGSFHYHNVSAFKVKEDRTFSRIFQSGFAPDDTIIVGRSATSNLTCGICQQTDFSKFVTYLSNRLRFYLESQCKGLLLYSVKFGAQRHIIWGVVSRGHPTTMRKNRCALLFVLDDETELMPEYTAGSGDCLRREPQDATALRVPIPPEVLPYESMRRNVKLFKMHGHQIFHWVDRLIWIDNKLQRNVPMHAFDKYFRATVDENNVCAVFVAAPAHRFVIGKTAARKGLVKAGYWNHCAALIKASEKRSTLTDNVDVLRTQCQLYLNTQTRDRSKPLFQRKEIATNSSSLGRDETSIQNEQSLFELDDGVIDSALIAWDLRSNRCRQFSADLSCTWGDEIQCYSDRDQVSFPFVGYSMGLVAQNGKPRTDPSQNTSVWVDVRTNQTVMALIKSRCHWYHARGSLDCIMNETEYLAVYGKQEEGEVKGISGGRTCISRESSVKWVYDRCLVADEKKIVGKSATSNATCGLCGQNIFTRYMATLSDTIQFIKGEECRDLLVYSVAFDSNAEVKWRLDSPAFGSKQPGSCAFLFVLQEHLDDLQPLNFSSSNISGASLLQDPDDLSAIRIPIPIGVLPYKSMKRNALLIKLQGPQIFSWAQRMIWLDSNLQRDIPITRFSAFFERSIDTSGACAAFVAAPVHQLVIGRTLLSQGFLRPSFWHHCRALMKATKRRSRVTDDAKVVSAQCQLYRDQTSELLENFPGQHNFNLDDGLIDTGLIAWDLRSTRCRQFIADLSCTWGDEAQCFSDQDKISLPWALQQMSVKSRDGRSVEDSTNSDSFWLDPPTNSTALAIYKSKCHWYRGMSPISCIAQTELEPTVTSSERAGLASGKKIAVLVNGSLQRLQFTSLVQRLVAPLVKKQGHRLDLFMSLTTANESAYEGRIHWDTIFTSGQISGAPPERAHVVNTIDKHLNLTGATLRKLVMHDQVDLNTSRLLSERRARALEEYPGDDPDMRFPMYDMRNEKARNIISGANRMILRRHLAVEELWTALNHVEDTNGFYYDYVFFLREDGLWLDDFNFTRVYSDPADVYGLSCDARTPPMVPEEINVDAFLVKRDKAGVFGNFFSNLFSANLMSCARSLSAAIRKRGTRGCNHEMIMKFVIRTEGLKLRKLGQGSLPFETVINLRTGGGLIQCYNRFCQSREDSLTIPPAFANLKECNTLTI